MYFVLGYDQDRVIFLTRQIFDTFTLAEQYANFVDQAWKPFIVERVVPT